MCRIVFVSLNKSNFIMMTMGQYFIIRQFVAMWCLKCLSISLDYSTNVGSQEWIHSTKSHKSVGKSEKDKCVLQRWHENLIYHKWQNITICSTFRNFLCAWELLLFISNLRWIRNIRNNYFWIKQYSYRHV